MIRGYEGRRMLYVHPDECVDCGACEPVCPVEAIYYEHDLPADLAAFTQLNIEFFRNVGSPGGASRHGRLEHDAPDVAELPPQA